MSLKVRFKFDGKCPDHPRYNPAKDGKYVNQLHGMQPCAGCDDLWCIYLYTSIANRRAEHARLVKSGQHYSFAPQEQLKETLVEAGKDLKAAGIEPTDEAKIQEIVKESRTRKKKTEKKTA